MTNSRRLTAERLEPRDLPALFGIPWVDGRNVTLSLMPDGTAIDARSSELFSRLAADGLSADVVRRQVARAAAAWAEAADVNIGVVADSGLPVGAPGSPQGDARFGDIRIGMRPLEDGVLAITTPPAVFAETRSGDILLNSNFRFVVGDAEGRHDLYTALLQELGHALGVGNSEHLDSAMYEYYLGTRTGLAASDGDSLRALYGPRRDDAYEAAAGNEARSSAAPLTRPTVSSTMFARGDVTKAGDVDYYSFVPTGLSLLPVGVRLRTAGLSLLAADVAVVNATGGVIAKATSGGAAGTDLAFFASLTPGRTYYIAVKATGTAFATGAYTLSVATNTLAMDPADSPIPLDTLLDLGTDDTVATATSPAPNPGTVGVRTYSVNAALTTVLDRDVYRLEAPEMPPGSTRTLVASVRGYIAAAPLLSFFDAAGKLLAAQDVSTGGKSRVFQVAGVTSGQTVYVRVSGDDSTLLGTYQLGAMFVNTGLDLKAVRSGTLRRGDDTQFAGVVVRQTQVMSYRFSSQATGGAAGLVWISFVEKATGREVHTWVAEAGKATSMTLQLDPGEYAVRIRTAFVTATAELAYQLQAATISDPIGVQKADPNKNPSSGTGSSGSQASSAPPPNYYYTYEKEYYTWAG